MDATMGSEAALRVELPTSLQALHLTMYVTFTVKFDKTITSSTDVPAKPSLQLSTQTLKLIPFINWTQLHS